MINIKTLKNIYKNEFYPFLENLGYKNVPLLVRGKNTYDYSVLRNFLETEISRSNSPLNKENLNEFLYNKLFFEKNNYHYVYNLSSFFSNSKNIEYTDIEEVLKNPVLHLNDTLSDFIPSNELELCNTKVITEFSKGKTLVSQIQFLFFIEELAFVKKGDINLFCCVDINLESNFLSFKFNHNLIDNLEDKTKLLDKLIIKLQSSLDILKDFNIKITTHNETTVKRTIQNLFIELSDQAEKLLQKQVDSGVERKIKEFLDDIKVPQTSDYIKQIISVAYQHVSKSFEKPLFKDGWAFRFVFKEGDNTRASSSNDDLDPVYSKQVYWNLKELMFREKGTDFIEAGLLWYTDKGASPVSIKIEQKNNLIILQYYRKEYNVIKRKEKEQYVLRKIRSGIPK
ncbi:hypothetical protein [Peribacillus muralis]|uniref:hypothetical protein n=1 Tax=Peribacillus muralis TaxID=264697 RepID=UPI003673554C